MRGGWQQPLPDMPAPPPERAWRRLDAPPGYEAQWRRLADAALELGLGPEQLGETGLDPLAAARGWKAATVALYSQGARDGGGGAARGRRSAPRGGRPRLEAGDRGAVQQGRPVRRDRAAAGAHTRARAPGA